MLDYLKGTRHPLSSALFVLPLLVTYEVGVLQLGDSTELRNGADAWTRSQLVVNGVAFGWALPVLVGLLLLVRLGWGWGERPRRPLACVLGMCLESVIFAAGLWALSRNFIPLLQAAGLPALSVPDRSDPKVLFGLVFKYLGSGVYEEVLFRLGLFGVLWLLMRVALLPKSIALVLAAVLGALAFAAAHHLGPTGDPFSTPVFLFRTAAGLVFTAVYVGRGLGVAVGAHAGYNILVGVPVG